MALNWNIGDIKDRHKLHNTGDHKQPEGSEADLAGDREWEITNHLIWMTIGVDIGKITEKNCEQFYQRMLMLDRASGNKTPSVVKLADVKARIGLSTNVHTTTDAVFANKVKKILVEGAQRAVSNEVADTKKEAAA